MKSNDLLLAFKLLQELKGLVISVEGTERYAKLPHFCTMPGACKVIEKVCQRLCLISTCALFTVDFE